MMRYFFLAFFTDIFYSKWDFADVIFKIIWLSDWEMILGKLDLRGSFWWKIFKERTLKHKRDLRWWRFYIVGCGKECRWHLGPKSDFWMTDNQPGNEDSSLQSQGTEFVQQPEWPWMCTPSSRWPHRLPKPWFQPGTALSKNPSHIEPQLLMYRIMGVCCF